MVYSLKQYIVEYCLLQRIRSNTLQAGGGDPQRTGLEFDWAAPVLGLVGERLLCLGILSFRVQLQCHLL